jgi:competence protein ComEC
MTHRPAVVLAFAFAAGILSENFLGPFPFLFTVIVLLGMAALGAFFKRIPFFPCLLILTFLCGAFAAWDDALLPLNHISQRLDGLRGRSVQAVCKVRSPSEQKIKGLAPKRVFMCELERVDGEPCSGRVIVNLFGDADFVYGDRVRLFGKFSRPFDFSPGGRISYRAYLVRQGIYAVLHVKTSAVRTLIEPQHFGTWDSLVLSVRLHLQAVFDRYLSAGEAGLMNAMLLGPRDDIPAHVYDIFRKTGTAHIIAISGMNMTLTAFGVVFLLGLFSIPRMPRAVLAVAILTFYSFMAGNSAPVARSALMAAVVILSFVIERETDALNSLALAALVLLAADPGQLGDIGCQLSFVCVVSLIVLTPLILEPFEDRGWKERKFLWFLAESAAVTLAAFIGSAGVLAYDFGYLTPIGLVVNLPVIPLMALVTALGAAVLFLGLVFPWIAGYFALCLKVVLNASVGVLTWTSFMPVIPCAGMSLWFVVLYYVILVTVTACFYYSKGQMTTIFEARGFIDKPMPL